MVYLLKVTVAWTLFLLLFEAFYKTNGRFAANRLYLLFSIAAGLLLPLIPLSSHVHVPPDVISVAVSTTQALYPATPDIAPEATAATVNAIAPAAATTSPDIRLVLRIIYAAGVLCLVLGSLWELGRITRLLLRRPSRIVDGHKVIVTGRNHAPYSFMNRIFIGDPDAYPPAELAYIIRHEAAHSRKNHGLDLLLLQVACITLWFHPLIWRFRHLLQLQHEYEADTIAAHDDPYAYGHFLLQQTLLRGVPSLAHSFHFSPIKNRIKMLTKRQNQKPGAWKYILAIPALLGCTFLLAKTTAEPGNMRQGNIITYRDNTFMWRESDTSFYYKERRSESAPAGDRPRKQVIYEMNGAPVYQNEYLDVPATYGRTERAYVDYVKKEFTALSKNTPDSLTVAEILNVVVSKEGKVVYYEARYTRPSSQIMQQQKKLYGNWELFPDKGPVPNSVMDKLITDGPDWKPAMKNGKPVNSMVTLGPVGC